MAEPPTAPASQAAVPWLNLPPEHLPAILQKSNKAALATELQEGRVTLGVPRARPAPEAALPAVFGQLFGFVGVSFSAVAPAAFHGFLQPPPLPLPP